MRVILDLDEDILSKLGEKAIIENRSRKNYMEHILQTEAKINRFKPNFQETTLKSYDAPPLNNYASDEAPMWQEPTKDYSYYEIIGKKVEFDNAEALIIEILAAPLLKNWQKPMLQKMINDRFF